MKIDPTPLQKLLKQVQEDLDHLADAPKAIEKYKEEAQGFKRLAMPDDPDSMKAWRAAEDRVEIAGNLVLRAEERMAAVAPELEQAVEDFASKLAKAGTEEANELADKLGGLLEPYCIDTQDLNAKQHARQIVRKVYAFNSIPQERNHPRLLGHTHMAVYSEPLSKCRVGLEVGRKLLSTFEEWQRNGGKFFVPGKH